MSRSATAGILSTLDYILAAVDTRDRHSDFGIVFHMKKTPSLEALRAGARSARNLYPVSGSVFKGRRWIPVEVPCDGVMSMPVSKNSAALFLNREMGLRSNAPIQQLLLTDAASDMAMLVTQVHHAAADGFSSALWLHHQFRIAAGLETPVREPAGFDPVLVRHHASSICSKASEKFGSSQDLWVENRQAIGQERWLTVELSARCFYRRCSDNGVNASDALAAATFETLASWNRRHGAPSQRIGLWLPVNIRQRCSSQFGNGSSRIRIHPGLSPGTSFVDRCRGIRRQIRIGLRSGEWALPENPAVALLPLWISGPLLRVYLNRPQVDMGTIAFSYVENWSGMQDSVFQDIEKVECVGQLHERHALAVNCVRHAESIWLTFTYDPRRLMKKDVEEMADFFRDQIECAVW
jgi:hypothetical protein